MAVEHFSQPKDQHIYMINNLDFIVSQLSALNLKRSKADLQLLQKSLETAVNDLIQVYLAIHFQDLFNLTNSIIQAKDKKKSKVDPEMLEKVSKDFLKTYK